MNAKVRTVTIKADNDQGHIVINESDYDPETHELLERSSETPAATAENETEQAEPETPEENNEEAPESESSEEAGTEAGTEGAETGDDGTDEAVDDNEFDESD